MMVKRVPAASSSMLDVLERVLDRGIVIDAWVGVSVAGIRVLEFDTRIVVASLDTYLARREALTAIAKGSRPSVRLVAMLEPSCPEPAPPPPPARRRPRPRQLSAQPTEATSQAPRLRCEKGCTFAWTKTDAPPVSMACPYRKRTRCRVAAG